MQDIKKMSDTEKLAKARELFCSITCLCTEGREFMKRYEIIEVVVKEALKGYEICK